MAIPLRTDEPQEIDNQKLTTADLAKGHRAAKEPKGPRPVLGGRMPAEQNLEQAAREPKQSASGDAAAPLFPNHELEALRSRWKEVQTAFVDEPPKALEQADGLVASAMRRLAEVFAEERANLEQQWNRGDHVSTEVLRLALQRYRIFLSAVVIGLKQTKRKAGRLADPRGSRPCCYANTSGSSCAKNVLCRR
jgi:hypothetical protein